MGRHNSIRVDGGRKRRILLATKMQGTNRSGGEGRRAYYVTPDQSYDYRKRRQDNKSEDNKWDGKKKDEPKKT